MRFTIQRKIGLAGVVAATVVALIMPVIANYGISSYLELSKKSLLLVEYQQAIGKLRVDLDRQVLLPNYFILTGGTAYAKNFVELSQSLETNLGHLIKNNMTPTQREKHYLTRIKELSFQIKNSAAELFSLSNPMENPKSIELIKKINFQLAPPLAEHSNKLDETVNKRVKTLRKKSEAIAASIWKFVVGGSVLCYPVFFLIASYTARVIARPINMVIAASKRVAEGDLGQTISTKSNDEAGDMGRSFNEMAVNLRLLAQQSREIAQGDLTKEVNIKGELAESFNGMVRNLRQLVEGSQKTILLIRDATSQILSAIEEQASGSVEQAASISEITATIEELSKTAQHIAENAAAVEKAAWEKSKGVQVEAETVTQMTEAMNRIKDKADELGHKVFSLGEKSQQVGRAVELIREIADETHLLALNAAIEASSAGEYGKRFSVIATEVRRLADKVRGSTDEIQSIITNMQAATNASVLATEQEVREVEDGVILAQKVEASLYNIANAIQAMVDASKQITSVTQQQKTASEQVVLTMRDISKVVSEMASSIKQSENATSGLNQMTEEFERRLYNEFKVGKEKQDG